MSKLREILGHSWNYMLANLATKALSFISIPVYTRLLTVDDYGVINIFNSTVSIAAIILTLNSEVAISRYFYDAKNEEDFKRFVGTSSRLTAIIFLMLSVVLIAFSKSLSQYLGIEQLLTIMIVPVSLNVVINNFFVGIYQPLLQSKKIAILSSLQSYLGFAMSVIAILLLKEKKYYGSVYGTIAMTLMLAGYCINQIKEYYKGCWSKSHVKYILSYAIPYLPYSLSSIIILQFGKVIIGQQQGLESAGLYSFASNISSIMMLLISVCHSAWNPYYFRYMNDKDYSSIDKDYDVMWRLTLIAGAGLSLFGYEVGSLLARPEFVSEIRLVPIFVSGYLFYQWSYVFLRNASYSKKMIWNAVIVIFSGIVNILLNSLLIGRFGSVGVAIAFATSYFVMLLISWFINRWVLKAYTPSMMKFISPLLLSVPVFIYSWFNPDCGSLWNTILVKTLILLLLTILLGIKWKGKLVSLIKSKF